MTPELEAKQRFIEALASPIREVARNPAIATTTAVRITRSLVAHGASNSFAPFDGGTWGGALPAGGPPGLRPYEHPPKRRDDPFGLKILAAELDRWFTSSIATLDVDSALEALDYDEEHAVMNLSNTDPYRLDHVDEVAYETIRRRGGNCGYVASVAFGLLRHAGAAPLDLIFILPRSGPRLLRNHTVAVVGIPDVAGNQKAPPFEQWADVAFLADAWADEEGVPASLLAKRWPQETYRYLSYGRVPPGGS